MRYTVEFCEREYNARLAVPDHPQIFARWADQAAATRRSRACLLDLPYGESPAEKLDLFPTRAAAAPLFVFIHGGYWRSRDKSEFSWIAPPLVSHGVAVALPNYGLAPTTPMEDIVRQVLGSLAWLYRNAQRYDIDRERIYVAGHSAGGHLTAMMMAAPPKKPNARPENRAFVDVAPKQGMLLLWESWLRHGVEPNGARGRRISVSFNYG